MAAGYVPNSPLSTLYSNTTSGTPASPDAVDGAIQALAQTINDNFDAAQTINNGLSGHKDAVVLDHPDQSVTTAKIKDANVTTAKLAEGSVTTAKIAAGAVTSDRIATGAVGTNQLDPALTENVAVAAEFQRVDAQLAETTKQILPDTTYKGAIITIIDDDGYHQFMDQWYLVCNNKGIRCSIGVYEDRVGLSNALSLAELLQLKSEGFDILAHSNASILSDAVAWGEECVKERDFIVSNGLGNGEALVYPDGFTESVPAIQRDLIKKETRKYFKYGIDALGGLNILPVDNYQVNRQGLGGKTFEQIKGYIDDAVAKQGWLIIITHSQLGTWNASLMEQWIDYAQSINVPIMTFTEAEKLVGNALSYGDKNTDNYLFVSKNGLLKHNENLTYSTFTMDMSVENYIENKETINEITAAQDTLLSLGGTLHTYHSRQSTQSYQLFYPSSRSYFYKREWNDSTLVWGDWYIANGYVVKADATANTMNAAITTYTKNITTRIYLSNVQDTFLGSGGMMEVYRGSTNTSYALFFKAGTGDIYRRVWLDGTSVWGTWERVNGIRSLTTAQRTALTAATLSTGEQIFDTTLNKPLWRNAANTGWVDATGTTV